MEINNDRKNPKFFIGENVFGFWSEKRDGVVGRMFTVIDAIYWEKSGWSYFGQDGANGPTYSFKEAELRLAKREEDVLL